MDLSRFHSLFFAESADQLLQAETALLALETAQTEEFADQEQDRERINEVFRAVHSIKGSAGTLGFDAITKVAHALEELFDSIRKQQVALNADIFSAAFGALDTLGSMVADARDGSGVIDDDFIAVQIDRLELAALAGIAVSSVEKCVSSIEDTRSGRVNTDDKAQTEFVIVFAPHASFNSTGNDPLLYLRELGNLGQAQIELDSSKLVALTELDRTQVHLRWNIKLVTCKTEADIRAVFEWVEDICDLTIQANAIPMTKPSAAEVSERSAAEPIAAKRSPTIHVRAERLDNLINQLGELAISHGYLKTSVAALGHADALSASLIRLERQVRELQDTVLGLRMLPLKVLFGRFDRVVRDAASELGKSVQLQIEGADTELDKNLIEKLIDPLTHLVRNALDHGMDSAAERLAQGKNAKGILSLKARHEAGSVTVTVADDGRGIDPLKIRKRAIELKLASQDDDFDEEQWLQFIYRAGFSTTNEANQWSGRGVGLDMVQQTIRSLGGDLYLRSQVGRGSSFHIRVPLTLAIVDALMIKVSHQTYALPLTSVRECVTRRQLRMTTLADGQWVGHIGGNLVAAVNLTDYLEHDSLTCEGLSADAMFIHVHSGTKSLLLGVEEIIGQDQIVVRSLEKNFKNPDFANGATLLGNGAVALILDANALIRRMRNEPVPQL